VNQNLTKLYYLLNITIERSSQFWHFLPRKQLNLFKVRLNYIIKLNRTKSGATYMAQNLKGVYKNSELIITTHGIN